MPLPKSGQADAVSPSYEMILAGAKVLIDMAELTPFFARGVAERVFLAMSAAANDSYERKDGSAENQE